MKKSLELRQLEILKIRKMLTKDSLAKRLDYLTKGFTGENEVVQWFILHGSKSWELLSNYWFARGNRSEIDLLIFTKNTLILLEIKNYDGHFEFRNGQCYINGRAMNENIMTQTQEKMRKMRMIAEEFPQKVAVKSAIVFINEHNKVDVDQTFTFDVVRRHELRKFILALKDAHYAGPTEKQYKNMLKVLAKYATESPFEMISTDKMAFTDLPTGITCQKCNSFNQQTSHKNITCAHCGHVETKHSAVFRTAEQLSLIFFDNPRMITWKNIYTFTGGRIGRTTIKKALSSKYPRIGNSKSAYYLIDLQKLEYY